MRFERGLTAIAAITVVLAAALALPSTSEAQLIAPSRRTTIGLVAGWHFPDGGVFDEHWNTGFALSGSLKRWLYPKVLSGFEVGYSWHSLDTSSIQAQYPAYSVSGGDLSVMPMAFVTDYYFGDSELTVRPFVSGNLGAYFLFTDNIKLNGPTSTSLNTYSDSVNFGAFGGAGALFQRSETWGARFEIGYAHVFRGGDDVGYMPIRIGIHWMPVY